MGEACFRWSPSRNHWPGHLNVSSGQEKGDLPAPVRQVPNRNHLFFTRCVSAGTKGFLAGGRADTDNAGLSCLPVAGKSCVQSSTHWILPGQECILPRNKQLLRIFSLSWTWRRFLLCMMVTSSHHAAGTRSSHQQCPGMVLWTSVPVFPVWGAQGIAHQQRWEMVSAILQNVRAFRSVRLKSGPRRSWDFSCIFTATGGFFLMVLFCTLGRHLPHAPR